jgi:hypothetical protein
MVVAAWLLSLAAAVTTIQLDSTFNVDDVKWVRESGTSTVSGKAFLKLHDGTLKDCAGFNVELLPVATYSSERIFRTYGNIHGGQVLLEDNPPKFTPDAPGYHEYVIKGTCNAQGEFRFEKVPAGDYFVMVFLIWDLPGLTPPVKTGGAVMKRIHVNPRAQVVVAIPQ